VLQRPTPRTTSSITQHRSTAIISDAYQLFDCDQSQLQVSGGHGQALETRDLLEANK